MNGSGSENDADIECTPGKPRGRKVLRKKSRSSVDHYVKNDVVFEVYVKKLKKPSRSLKDEDLLKTTNDFANACEKVQARVCVVITGFKSKANIKSVHDGVNSKEKLGLNGNAQSTKNIFLRRFTEESVKSICKVTFLSIAGFMERTDFQAYYDAFMNQVKRAFYFIKNADKMDLSAIEFLLNNHPVADDVELNLSLGSLMEEPHEQGSAEEKQLDQAATIGSGNGQQFQPELQSAQLRKSSRVKRRKRFFDEGAVECDAAQTVRKVTSEPKLKRTRFKSPIKKSKSLFLDAKNAVLSSDDDLDLTAKEKKFVRAVRTNRTPSPKVEELNRSIMSEIDINSLEDSPAQPVNGKTTPPPDEQEGEVCIGQGDGRDQLKSRWPVSNVEYLEWVSSEKGIQYLKDVMLGKTSSHRHEAMMESRAVDGRTDHLRYSAKLDFLNDQEAGLPFNVDLRILELMRDNVLKPFGPPPDVANRLRAGWETSLFARNYITLALNPEGLTHFMILKYNISKEEAEEQFLKMRYTDAELDFIEHMFDERHSEKKKVETLEELRAREGEDVWNTLPDLTSEDEDGGSKVVVVVHDSVKPLQKRKKKCRKVASEPKKTRYRKTTYMDGDRQNVKRFPVRRDHL